MQKIYYAGAKNAVLLSALVILISATRVLLFLLPLQLVVQILRRGAACGRRNTTTVSSRRRRRFSWAVRAVGKRLLPERPCLTQALVLQSLLRWYGDNSSELCIGVDKDESGGLIAHAWVEYDGKILIGGASSRKKFQELSSVERKLSKSKAKTNNS